MNRQYEQQERVQEVERSAPAPAKQPTVEHDAAAQQRAVQRLRLQRRGKDKADEAAPAVHQAAQQGVQGGGGPLPHAERIQRAFGRHDISAIQAHQGPAAQQASDAIGAEAYATGNHIAFGGGEPDLHTAAHEAAHVVQQREGVHLKGGVGHEGDEHERHADAVADAVVAGRSAEPLLDRYAGRGDAAPAGQAAAGGVQRKVKLPSGTVLDDTVPGSIQQLVQLADVGTRGLGPASAEANRLLMAKEEISFGTAMARINRAAESAPQSAGSESGDRDQARKQQIARDQVAQEQASSSSSSSSDFDLPTRDRRSGEAPLPPHRQAMIDQLVSKRQAPLQDAHAVAAQIATQVPLSFEQRQLAGRTQVVVGAVTALWGAIQIALDVASAGLATPVSAPISAAVSAGGNAAVSASKSEGRKQVAKETAKGGAKTAAITGAKYGYHALEGGASSAASSGGSVASVAPFVGGAVNMALGLRMVYQGIFKREDIGPKADQAHVVALDGEREKMSAEVAQLTALRDHPDYRGLEHIIDAQIDAMKAFLTMLAELRDLYNERMAIQGSEAPATRSRSGASTTPPPPPPGGSGGSGSSSSVRPA